MQHLDTCSLLRHLYLDSCKRSSRFGAVSCDAQRRMPRRTDANVETARTASLVRLCRELTCLFFFFLYSSRFSLQDSSRSFARCRWLSRSAGNTNKTAQRRPIAREVSECEEQSTTLRSVCLYPFHVCLCAVVCLFVRLSVCLSGVA